MCFRCQGCMEYSVDWEQHFYVRSHSSFIKSGRLSVHIARLGDISLDQPPFWCGSQILSQPAVFCPHLPHEWTTSGFKWIYECNSQTIRFKLVVLSLPPSGGLVAMQFAMPQVTTSKKVVMFICFSDQCVDDQYISSNEILRSFVRSEHFHTWNSIAESDSNESSRNIPWTLPRSRGPGWCLFVARGCNTHANTYKKK